MQHSTAPMTTASSPAVIDSSLIHVAFAAIVLLVPCARSARTTARSRARSGRYCWATQPRGRHEGTRSRPRGRAMPRPCSACRAGGRAPRRSLRRARPPGRSRSPSAERLLFGAVARWIAAWLRLSCASGSPTCSSACAAATATSSACGIGHPDVLAGEDDHPPGDEAGVLAGLQHPRQVVDGGLRIAAAHALDERADDVVVVVASVAQRAGAERRLDVLDVDRARRRERAGDLERGEHLPTVAAGTIDEQVDRLRRRVVPSACEAATDQLADRLRARAARGGTACCGCAAAG